jgi:hypothetical protein
VYNWLPDAMVHAVNIGMKHVREDYYDLAQIFLKLGVSEII